MAARSVYPQREGDAASEPLFLRRLSRFAALGPAQKDGLCAVLSRPMRFATHGDLMVEGVSSTAGYVIDQGWACSYKLLRDGKRQILGFVLPGDHVTETDLQSGGPGCSVAALTPVVVRPCHASGLAQLRERHGQVRQALDATRQLEMAMLRDHLVNIGRRNAYQRLAHLILELYWRLRIVGLADGNSFGLPITQEMIADALGLSNVHVNRTLRRLVDDGIACHSGDRLAILDRRALADIAEFEESYLGQFLREKGYVRENAVSAPRRWPDGRAAGSGAWLANAGDLS